MIVINVEYLYKYLCIINGIIRLNKKETICKINSEITKSLNALDKFGSFNNPNCNEIIRRKSKDISPIDKATLAKANTTFRFLVSLKYTIEFNIKENKDIKKIIINICCIDFTIF